MNIKKKVGIIILSRFSSQRLPGKALKPIVGKPLLGYIVEKVCTAFADIPVVIATSDQPSDEVIEKFGIDMGVKVYRGSLENVSLRFLEAAEFNGFDYAVRITGDSLFIDVAIIKQLITKIGEDNFDLISNRKYQMYPIGQSVEIVNVSCYRRVMKYFSTPEDFEHVTNFFYQHEDDMGFRIYHHVNPHGTFRDVSLAIDTVEDFEMATKVVTQVRDRFNGCSYREVYELYKNFPVIREKRA